MTVSQISVFANSRPGHMNRVLDLFEGAGVSVRGFSSASSSIGPRRPWRRLRMPAALASYPRSSA